MTMYDEQYSTDATANAEDAVARLVQEGETPAAHDKFLIYLGLPSGSRSLAAAYRLFLSAQEATAEGRENTGEEIKAAPREWERLSSRFNWVERVEKYQFHIGLAVRAETANRQLADIEAFKDKVKKVSDRKQAFFLRINQICHRRLSECERQDLRAAEQQVEWLQKEIDAELSGEPFKKPSGRPVLPVPFSEYESIARAFSRASAVVSDGLRGEGEAIGVNALLIDLNTQRQKDEQD